MTNTEKRSVDDTARAAQEFLETIHASALRLDIQPQLTVSLFGMFARRIVAIMVDNGVDGAEAHVAVVAAFTNGLGINTITKEANEQEAEQMRAEFERANQDTPLQ